MGISRRKPFSLREKLNRSSSAKSFQVGEAGLYANWRIHLQPGSRSRIVNKILETLRRHLPFSGEEGLNELRRIAARFEEKIYNVATSQSDYLRKISLKMLSMESRPQNAWPYSLPPTFAGGSNSSSSHSLPGTA
ncbi:Mediator of RNA polymerase II transcription subunit 15a-like [Melia azedarach]|uniref:Mediator of RNA polymerase II transcription subunit 15a-like n=1 Tax=Melia azedarach TaxID=155640 RepID=A0ACC1Y6I1_MELAZ|nr:Mediator of RNA polymerase II transcription subunit 15a-like [Melia azedarach]